MAVPTPELLLLLVEKNIGPEGSIHSVDWSPDGRTIATTARDHVRLWDGETYEELAILKGFRYFAWCARWSPDGRLLAVTDAAVVVQYDDSSAVPDGRLWTVADATGPIRLYDARTYTEQGTLGGSKAQQIAWSPDGKLLAAANEFNKTVQVWDIETRAVAFELEGDSSVSSLAWSPDGRTLAVGQFDASVILWDIDTRTRGQRLIDGRNIPPENEAQSLSWSPDGRRVAYIQRHDGHWRIWDTQTGELVLRVAAHNSQGFALSWASNRPLLASVGWDKAVRIWDAETGQPVGTGECSAPSFRSVDWSPDGRRVVMGSGLFFKLRSPEIICIMEVP